jgi:hypothetical protein
MNSNSICSFIASNSTFLLRYSKFHQVTGTSCFTFICDISGISLNKSVLAIYLSRSVESGLILTNSLNFNTLGLISKDLISKDLISKDLISKDLISKD